MGRVGRKRPDGPPKWQKRKFINSLVEKNNYIYFTRKGINIILTERRQTMKPVFIGNKWEGSYLYLNFCYQV